MVKESDRAVDEIKQTDLQTLLKAVDCIDRVTHVGCGDTPLESRRRIQACPDIEHRSPWAEDPFHLSAIHKEEAPKYEVYTVERRR